MKPEEFKALFELEDHFWWFVGMRRIVEALQRPLALADSPRILDVGCGTGYMLRWWEEVRETSHVFGTDISPVALDFCRRRDLRLLVQASARHLPFASKSIDLVTCFDVMVMFPVDELQASIQELTRVLKPGGLLIIRVSAFEWLRSEHDRAFGNVHRFTAPELRQALTSQGLKIERLTYANTALFPVAVIWRWLRRSSRPDPQSDVRPLPKGLRWINRPLAGLLMLEALWLRLVSWRLPFGLSLIALARKSEG